MKFFDLLDEDSRGEKIKDKYRDDCSKLEEVVKTYFLKTHEEKRASEIQVSPVKREIKDLWS